MHTADFLAHVLGDEGYYCAVGLNDSGRRVQKLFDTRDKLQACAENFDANGLNAYYAMATFNTGENRTVDNAHSLKSFFIDLDCGPGKDYPSQKEANAALKKFVAEVGLPVPLRVNSGRGIHAYWVLDKPVPVDEWKRLASKFKQLLVERGVRADPSVTADAARILRVPGTHNMKDDPPKPVRVVGSVPPVTTLDVLRPIFLQGAQDAMVFDVPPMDIKDDPSLDKLMGGIKNCFRTLMKKGSSGCLQMARAYKMQEEVSEPTWRAALSIAKHCEDGLKWAHKLSDQHPDYDPEETTRKYNNIDAGPYTCAKFDESAPGICQACPHFGKIKSPILLAKAPNEATDDTIEGVVKLESETLPAKDLLTLDPEVYKIPALPARYYRGSNGGMFIRPADADEEPEMIYTNTFYFTHWVEDPEEGQIVICRVHLPQGVTREFPIRLTHLTSREEMRKVMAHNGIAVSSKGWERLMTYSIDWVHKLQAESELMPSMRQYGWVDEEKLDAFVIGDRLIKASSVEYTPPSSVTSMSTPWFRPQGTIEGWKQNAAFYNDEEHLPMQFMVLLTLGAPLAIFMPDVNAAIFNLWSNKSGHGKTTAQYVGLAAYAEPKIASFRNQDTVNSRFNRMELFKNLPLVVDEVTNWDPHNLSNVIYDTTGGMQKARMHSGSNTERYRGQPWTTTVTMSANESLREKLLAAKGAPEAEQMRMLEYCITTEMDTTERLRRQREATEFVKRIRRHRGHAAVPFVQYIINNRTGVERKFSEYVDRLTAECHLQQQHRFYKAMGATALTACEVANATGLLTYDIDALYRWVVALINGNMNLVEITKMDAHKAFSEFMVDNQNKFLVIESGADLRAAVSATGSNSILVMPDKESRTELYGRYEPDTKMIYFSTKKLEDWCKQRNVSYSMIRDMFRDQFNAGLMQKKIGKGTKLPVGNVRVIAIDCGRNNLEVVDWGE